MRGFGEKLKSKNKGKKVEKVMYAVIKSLAGKIWKIEGIEIGRKKIPLSTGKQRSVYDPVSLHGTAWPA